ncbi:MAG: SprT-like domain-containing protein [Candidatus Binatia bacterium]
MANSAQFAVSDAVTFSYRNREWVGSIVKKERTIAHVITEEAREFRVPYQWLTKIFGQAKVPLHTRSEVQRAAFAAGDRVSFAIGSREMQGVIARLNPQRAHVVADDGREYRASYALLRHVQRTSTARVPTRTAEELQRLAQVARGLLTQHHLLDWSFQFDNGRKRAGCCQYGTKVISLSYEFAKHAPDEEITDTVLHEIAHALVGKSHNHDDVWRAMAARIGCSGRRCHEVQFTLPRYLVKCEHGCWLATAERRQRHVVCKRCRGAVIYLTYTEERWQAEVATRREEDSEGSNTRGHGHV